MAITVNTNVSSLTAQRNLQGSGKLLSQSLQRLSSGLRINSAKDDAAGLAISDRMNSQIRGLNQAVRNANDGISLAQTAEGAMGEVTNNLQRIRELSVQAANATNTAEDRQSLNAEVTQLVSEIDRIANSTSFNGNTMLNGSFSSKSFQVGSEKGQTISFSIASAKADALGVGSSPSYTTAVTGAAVTGAGLAVGDLTVNGFNVGATTTDGVSSVDGTGSAIAVASAINAISGDTGVTAEVVETSVTGIAAAAFVAIAGDTTDNVTINGVTLGALSAATDAVDRGNDLGAAINAVADQTGVTASVAAATGIITLTATDGRNIDIGGAGTGVVANTGLTVATTYSSVNLSSSSADGITIGGADEAAAGLGGATGNTAATMSASSGVSSIDISTQAGAENALAVIDSAIARIDSERGNLGAVQNRMESTIANLMNVSENVSAARSRIVDADFASETASLTKSQILQQAGLAMLSQANQVPQAALSLLQG